MDNPKNRIRTEFPFILYDIKRTLLKSDRLRIPRGNPHTADEKHPLVWALLHPPLQDHDTPRMAGLRHIHHPEVHDGSLRKKGRSLPRQNEFCD